MTRRGKKDVPEIIRKLRAALDLTQEQFAAMIGVTVSTANRWENGKRRPSPLAMLRIEELENQLKQNKQSE